MKLRLRLRLRLRLTWHVNPRTRADEARNQNTPAPLPLRRALSSSSCLILAMASATNTALDISGMNPLEDGLVRVASETSDASPHDTVAHLVSNQTQAQSSAPIRSSGSAVFRRAHKTSHIMYSPWESAPNELIIQTDEELWLLEVSPCTPLDELKDAIHDAHELPRNIQRFFCAEGDRKGKRLEGDEASLREHGVDVTTRRVRGHPSLLLVRRMMS